MRILQLDLLAFGPFTDQSLRFGNDGGGLHLVYGPNEAGKSSALRALKQLLYGIPSKSADNFVHAYGDLRIGATFRTNSGGDLQVIRRKGQKNTLRGADDDRVVNDIQLSEMLGELDSQNFERRYGIDYDELVQGGQLVADGKGDLATLLFAAGTGVADLGRIQRQLEDQADELFKPRASKPRICEALAKLKELRETAAATRLRTTDWTQLDAELRAERSQDEQLRTELGRLRAAHARQHRYELALVLAARRRDLVSESSELQDVPILSKDSAKRRNELTLRQRVAEHALQTNEDRCASLDQQLREIARSSPVLVLAERIEECNQRLGSHRKAAEDRLKLETERGTTLAQLAATARDLLGRVATSEEINALHVSPVQRTKIEGLAAALDKFDIRQREIQRQLDELDQQRRAAEQQFGACGEIPDTGEFERAVRRAQKASAYETQLAKLRRDAELARQRATTSFARLGLWTGPPDQLARLAVPSSETVDRWQKVFERQAREIEALEIKLASVVAERDRLTAELVSIDEGRTVPTVATLSAARARRDEGWQLVRSEWESGKSDPHARDAFVAATPGVASLGEAFGRSIVDADAVADHLRSEAERVARKAEATSRLTLLERDLAARSRQIEALHGAHAESKSQWCAVWSVLGSKPLEPAEMRGWLTRQLQTIEELLKAQTLELEVEQLAARLDHQRLDLLAVWSSSDGSIREREFASLSEAVEEAERAVAAWRTASSRREALKASVEQLSGQRLRAEQDLESAARERAALTEPWAREMQQLSLSTQASTAAAKEQLQGFSQLQELTRALAKLDERLAGIERDADEFRRQVSELLEQTAVNDLGGAIEAAPVELLKRLKAERDADARRQSLLKDRKKLETSLADERKQVAAAKIEVEQLCVEAGVAAEAELPEAERRSDRRRNVEDELREVDRQLAKLAAPETTAAFAEQVLSQNPEQLAEELARLHERIETADVKCRESATKVGALEARVQQLGGGPGSVDAEFQIQQVAARLQNDAREYARLRLAAVVLRRASERYRERGQGPMVRRAAELFEELTLGSFVGLRADFDDAGKPVLLGVRPDRRRTIPIAGLSTGTRDQLYLALRLASLELDVTRRETPPLIVDDILIQFDDPRSAAALRILARLAERLQIVFFTHHAHLIDLARQTLAANAFQVYELSHTADSSGTLDVTRYS